MKRIPAFLALLLVCSLFLWSAGCIRQQDAVSPTPDRAQAPVSRISNETLVAFVNSAAAYAKTHGAREALAEFNNINGSFVKGELYIYAYGFNGTTLAHPVSPESVGKKREGETGRFVEEMGAVVRNGTGFYRFTYINPQHNRTLESKLGYGVQVADDWWLGSGVYTGPVT